MIKAFIYFLILMPIAGFSQQSKAVRTADTSIKTLTSKMDAYAANHTIEKAYLQFDKPYYAIGDTIYFKAYVTLGAFHKLSALSGILYVDLISPENKITRSKKLQVTAGVAWGDFTLTDTLKSGSYRVLAYTNWMRNEGETAFFKQSIQVGGLSAGKISESGGPEFSKSAKKKADVKFLPEGGNLVAGNYSKMAFKAIGPDGLATDIKGTVTDEAGTEVCSFASTHLGMGAFSFVPVEGKVYKANLTYTDGSVSTLELPKAIKNGYTINLNNSNPDTIRIRITAGSGAATGKISLIAQSAGIVYYASEKQTDGKFFSAAIPKNKFPTGIVQFTIFSQNGEPLNERLAFVNHHDELKLAIVTDKKNYSARQKGKITLLAKDKNGKPETGSFSVAITDETVLPVDTMRENTILSNLLLTSELKGVVEDPGYYFSNTGNQEQADLDNLMLTQGYRHFEWKKVLSDTSATAAYQPEKSIDISGTVKRNGKPAAHAKVTLFSKTGGLFMLDTLTNEQGKFAFKDLVFGDSTKFVVQAKVPRGQDDVMLELDSIVKPHVSLLIQNAGEKLQTQVNEDISSYIINQKQFYAEQQKYGINQHPVVLREVKVEAKKEPIIPHSANLNGSGNADQVLTSKDIERFICAKLSDCLQGVLIGVSFVNGLPTVPVILDGMVVDRDIFADLRPEDIEGIEVIRGPHYGAIYGSVMAKGGMIVTTKRARKTDGLYYRYAPGVITYMPKGFYKAREFYSPQYDNPHTNQKMADLRSTIYWNPNIITDKDGKASFNYFNADGKGTYRVVIEGIDADGNLGRQVLRYKVE